MICAMIGTTMPAYATTSAPSITSLAQQIATYSAKAHDGGLAQQLAAPVLQVLSSSTFDWNLVLFGTDNLTPDQAKVSASLVPELSQLVTLQDSTQSQAESLISSIVASMQALNPAVQASDVVSYLSTIVSDAPSEMFNLAGLQTAANMEQSLNSAFQGYIQAASRDIRAIFQGTVASTTGSGPGSASGSPGSGASGTASGSASGPGNPSGPGAMSGSGTAGSNGSNGSSSSSGNGSNQGLGSSTSGGGSTAAVTGSGTVQGSGVTSGSGAPSVATILQKVVSTHGGVWHSNLPGGGAVSVVVQPGAISKTAPLDVSTYNLPKSINLPRGTQWLDALSLSVGQQMSLKKPITVNIHHIGITQNTLVYEVGPDGLIPLATPTASFANLSFIAPSSATIVMLTPPPARIPKLTFKPAPLSKGQRAVYLNNHLVTTVDAIVHDGTTYMPLRYVMKTMRLAGIPSTWNGRTLDLKIPSTVPERLTGLTGLTPRLGNASIQFNGQTVQMLSDMIVKDPITHRPITYVPIAKLMQVLPRLSITSSWDGQHWVINAMS